jgi:hypothetical protein
VAIDKLLQPYPEDVQILARQTRETLEQWLPNADECVDESLCANMTETSCVTPISEQGGKETQHGNDERFCSARRRCDGSI